MRKALPSKIVACCLTAAIAWFVAVGSAAENPGWFQDGTPADPSFAEGDRNGATVTQDEKASRPQESENGVDTNENTMERFVRGLRSLRKHSRLAPEMVELFAPSVGSASASTVRLYHGRKQVAIGVIVDSSGLILTKASELRVPLECQLPNGNRVPATIYGIDLGTDLAMVRVAVDFPLNSAELTLVPSPPVGRWLASVAVDPQPISLGVVSVLQRQITSSQARMGILPEDHPKGVRITQVTSDSPADKANLMVNDIIIRIDDAPTPDAATLRKIIANYEPGDSIAVTFLRLDKEMTTRVILFSVEELGGMAVNPQESMGSTLTRRRLSYALAFQHDSGLQANQCGSPLVDIDGQIVGINIARAGRVATYALPMEIVVPTVQRLKTGELAPSVVFRKEIAELDAQIAAASARVESLPRELADAEQELPRDAAKREELERTIAELQRRVEELRQIEQRRRDFIEEGKNELKHVDSELKKLRERRDSLLNGIR